jgi:hypothetical protein
MPFHHTLGISGYETYFNHPDELFYALSIAVPYLPKPTANRLKNFLRAQLETSPPYAEEGLDNHTGRPRESYDVPTALRRRGRGRADSAFGVYAFWAYIHFTGDTNAAKAQWPAVQARMKPLLEGRYGFDVTRKDSNKGEAQKLTGSRRADWLHSTRPMAGSWRENDRLEPGRGVDGTAGQFGTGQPAPSGKIQFSQQGPAQRAARALLRPGA